MIDNKTNKIIKSEEVLELLFEMIRTPSANYGECEASEGAEQEMAKLVVEYCNSLGLEATMQEVMPGRPNVICSIPGKNPSKTLAFCAHLDTVPPASEEDFKPYIKDNKVHGRGSCDTKASLVAMLMMMKVLTNLIREDEKYTPPCTITLIGSVDEESSFKGAYHLLDSGFTANGLIAGEPTNLDLMIAHGGIIRWKVKTKGKSAHSADPEKGINAIYAMSKVIDFYNKKAQQMSTGKKHYLVGHPSLIVATISGGTKINIVPDHCGIEIDHRILPGEKPLTVWKNLKEELLSIEQEISPAKLVVEEPFMIDYPLETGPDTHLATVAKKSIESVVGSTNIIGAAFGTDASKFGNVGIPSVVFGPGNIEQAHADVEFVDIDQVLDAIKILVRIALNFKK